MWFEDKMIELENLELNITVLMLFLSAVLLK